MKSPRVLLVSILLALLVSGVGCADEGGEADVNATGEDHAGEIREAVVAGAFYPGDPGVLAADIDRYLDSTGVGALEGEIVAIISPHAGYVYSGGVAAHAYAHLRGRAYDSVIVVAPSHRYGFRGASVFGGDGYETPLGVVSVDRELADAITDEGQGFTYEPRAHEAEHSLEVQLPFLQVAIPGLRVVPIVMGDQSLDGCKRLGRAIASNVKDMNVLLVASSDLSHFHPYNQAKRLDQIVVDEVNEFDPQGLSNDLASKKCEACGGGPMVTAMLIARRLGANKSRVLHYANSGDITGDHSSVVGYMAAALWANPENANSKEQKSKKVGVDLGLSPEEKANLLKIARDVVEAHCRGEKTPEISGDSSTLNEQRGAFVTLHKHGKLRGCIGHIRAKKPLVKTVAEMAIAAAFDDPRFPPVTPKELGELEYEISVLTPFQQISNVEEIEVGVHGLYMKSGSRSGLLLPQVATEWGWDRNTFLEHTCTKAGLPEDAWKDKKTKIYIFSADVFSPDNL